jgi:stearoyl-CoA desaturase (delta-9 desaturase)
METAFPTRPSWRAIYFNRKTVVFWGVHIAAIWGVITLGWSWTGLALALALYAPRMFFITGANHRYFSHRSFRTSRAFQFVLALGAVACGEKGVIWWASHHRRHHRFSDRPGDAHSPREGFWWSHIGWMLSYEHEWTDHAGVKDLTKYPELRALERVWMLPPIAVGLLTWWLGGTFGLVWGFLVCQVLFWHGTFSINSLAHVFGTRPYKTKDDSRNHWLLALITFGEGWHNNHHHRPGVCRQGLHWWQIDFTYYGLRALAAVGLIWDLHQPKPDAEAVTEEDMAPVAPTLAPAVPAGASLSASS